LIPIGIDDTDHQYLKIKSFYPSYYDGNQVDKFIIPIRPEYHDRLFISSLYRQTKMEEYMGDFITEGNTIKKAYLSHSKSRQMKEGDVVLFYRSIDRHEITSVGVIDLIEYDQMDSDTILSIVGKRTVYTYSEIEEFSKRPSTIILFRHHFELPHPINLYTLFKHRQIRGAPQSITQITDEQYHFIIKRGGIDERYTFH